VLSSFSVQTVPEKDAECLTHKNVIYSFKTPVIVQQLTRRSVAENLILKYDFITLDTDEKLNGIDEERTMYMKECSINVSRHGMIQASTL